MKELQKSTMARFKAMISLIFANTQRVLFVLYIVFSIFLIPLSLVLKSHNSILFFPQLYLYIFSISWIVLSMCNDLNCFISLGYRRKEIYDNLFKIFLGISGIASILVVLLQHSINSGKEGIVFLGIVFSRLNFFSLLVIFLLSFIFFMGISVLANDSIMMGIGNIRYWPQLLILSTVFIIDRFDFKSLNSKLFIPLFVGGVVFIYFSYKYGLKAFKNKDI